MLNNKILAILALAAAAALAGCASSGTKTRSTGMEGGDSGSTSSVSPYGGESIAGEAAQIGAGTAAADAALAAERSLMTNVIFFEFDKSEIAPEYQGVVDGYAKLLLANPSTKVQLEGHADERGTREYNVGLGERRANTVQSALMAQGAQQNQISVLSYGEERPADGGHGEDAWAKNRRVQIIRQ